MSKVHSLEHYIKILNSKLGEAKGCYKKSLLYRDCGVSNSYYKGRIEILEQVIAELEKLQNKDKSE